MKVRLAAIACLLGCALAPRQALAQTDDEVPSVDGSRETTDATDGDSDAATSQASESAELAPASGTFAGPRPARIRIQHHTILRLAPRYELVTDSAAQSTYWRRVLDVPIYELVSLHAEGLQDGHTEVHVSAWGALDATFPSDSQLMTGDFATAYAETRYDPVSFWGGRRFLTWGLPGGLHVDAVGTRVAAPFGLSLDAFAGRPVVARYTTLGAHSEFTEPTLAFGARLAYELPQGMSASVSYLERWAEGIAADRSLMVTAFYQPHPRVDLLGTTTFDVRDGIEEARFQSTFLLSRTFEADLGYVHADPRRLLPAWSILSMFATNIYDETSVGLTARVAERQLSIRGEAGVRYSHYPGETNEDDSYLGSRGDLLVRWRPSLGTTELVARASRREDGDTALWVGRVAAAFVPAQPLRVVATLGAAVDENESARTAFLGRGSAELPISSHWATSLTADVARTPIARWELRGLVRVSYALDSGAL